MCCTIRGECHLLVAALAVALRGEYSKPSPAACWAFCCSVVHNGLGVNKIVKGGGMAQHCTKAQLDKARADREILGMSLERIARKYGLSLNVLKRLAKDQLWGDGSNVDEASTRIAKERACVSAAAGVGQTVAERIASSADKKAKVLIRQQKDWEEHREAFRLAGDKDELMRGKLSAEMLKLRHEGERKAYSISDAQETREQSVKTLADFYK